MNKLIKLFKHPEMGIQYVSEKGFFDFLPDKLFLEFMYRVKIGQKLHLDDPKTFNEKLQWLKLYNRKPEYIKMVDKYAVREYIAKELGEEYLIPLLGVWDDPDDIDFDSLPDKFVLKCNHNSGTGMCICKDKSSLDIETVKKNLRKGLKQDYYKYNREWPYKDVKRKIIAEQYMEDDEKGELVDYKFMCFNGKVQCSFTCTERFSGSGLKVSFFDIDWNRLPFIRQYPQSTVDIKKPKNYDEMVIMAEKLSKGIPFVRIDFYEINKKMYFGEITFFPGSGYEKFTPEEWDLKLGEMINLT